MDEFITQAFLDELDKIAAKWIKKDAPTTRLERKARVSVEKGKRAAKGAALPVLLAASLSGASVPLVKPKAHTPPARPKSAQTRAVGHELDRLAKDVRAERAATEGKQR